MDETKRRDTSADEQHAQDKEPKRGSRKQSKKQRDAMDTSSDGKEEKKTTWSPATFPFDQLNAQLTG